MCTFARSNFKAFLLCNFAEESYNLWLKILQVI